MNRNQNRTELLLSIFCCFRHTDVTTWMIGILCIVHVRIYVYAYMYVHIYLHAYTWLLRFVHMYVSAH